MTAMRIDQITADEADAILTGQHYLGPVEYPPRFALATPGRECVAVFGHPIAAAFKTAALSDPVELVRLWRREGATIRTDHFLHRAIRMLRTLAPECDCVFTYADPGAGHTGATYRGCGFSFAGQGRAVDRWQTADGIISAARAYRLLGTKSRARTLALRPDWQLIEGVAKLLFIYPLRGLSAKEVIARVGEKSEARRAMFSRAHAGFAVHVYQDKFPPRKCAYCGELFLAKRSDARTCSASCRTMLSRKRQAA
ncbi:MAG: hypothetical protein ABSA90_06915 [Xanthobacteraceae bacterium]